MPDALLLEQAREAARAALRDAPGRFILGADCTVPGGTPCETLRAATDEVHCGAPPRSMHLAKRREAG
jgi:hypothetical protein